MKDGKLGVVVVVTTRGALGRGRGLAGGDARFFSADLFEDLALEDFDFLLLFEEEDEEDDVVDEEESILLPFCRVRSWQVLGWPLRKSS